MIAHTTKAIAMLLASAIVWLSAILWLGACGGTVTEKIPATGVPTRATVEPTATEVATVEATPAAEPPTQATVEPTATEIPTAEATEQATSAEEQIERWKECAMTDLLDITYEEAFEVREKYREMFMSHPNLGDLAIGKLREVTWGVGDPEMEELGDALGIIVGLREDVEQATVSQEQRIPDCLDGIPVRVTEVTPQTYADKTATVSEEEE